MAHVDAGKTTVTEGILYHCGITRQMGRVDQGNTVTDSMELEQKRGMTIRSSTVSFELNGMKINLIDTPGHMDFLAEVENSLKVLDGVILVISAREGVQSQTRRIFRQLRRMKLPVILFVNKIDRPGVELEAICRRIGETLTDRCVIMQEALAGKECYVRSFDFEEELLCEQILMRSEALMERYLENDRIRHEEYLGWLRFRIQKSSLYPVYFGAALKDVGVRELLDAVSLWFSGREKTRRKDALSAYVYKIEWGERHHKKAYLRVFSGSLQLRTRQQNCRLGEMFTVGSLYCLAKGKEIPVSKVDADDIGILYDVECLRCGDFIGSCHPLKGDGRIAEPLLNVCVRPADPGKRSLLLSSLQELMCENPSLSLSIREETGEIMLRLFGGLQIEILQNILKEKYHVEVCFDELMTIQKEKAAAPCGAAIRLGDRGNPYPAGIELQIEPLPPGSGIQYETRVSFGFIEKPFQNAVREGVEIGAAHVLEHELTDTRIVFTNADYDSVMGTPAAYRRLAPLVLKKALIRSGTRILKPYMRFDLAAPAACEKEVQKALGRMKAEIAESVYAGSDIILSGGVEYERAKDFYAKLMSMTEGNGSFEMRLSEYRE